MTPEHITALAEACERAADYLRDSAGHCSDYRTKRANWCSGCVEDYGYSDALAAHAAALRAGRVTITEEATNDAAH